MPKVSDLYDTRYFDQEGSISDVDDASSVSSIREEDVTEQEIFEQEVVKAYAENRIGAKEPGNVDGADFADGFGAKGKPLADEVNAQPKDSAVRSQKVENGMRLREKKRPRDRILRDPSVAKEALELRKQGAFAGYAYRRPRAVLSRVENLKEGRCPEW